jgi:hypothetical protein
MTATNEIVRVPFLDGYIETVLVGEEPHVVLKPALTAMGLDYEAQRQKLRRKSWATTFVTQVVAGDGKVREMATVDLDTWSMLLANIDERRVNEDSRDLVIDYQKKSARALRDFWTRGGAINPAATEDQLDALISQAKGQAEVLGALRGIVDAAWLETKARLVAARALGEEPEIDPLDAPLYVPDFLKDKGLNRRQIESVQSWFGRRAAALYEAEHGEKPGKRQADLPNGSVRETYAWTERHRPLFEETWNRYYAEQFPAAPRQLGLDGGGP